MNSQELKLAVIRFFLFDRKYSWTFTESLNQADVLAVRGNYLSHEIEIKVSKEDFTKEAKAIEFITGKDRNMRRARGANKVQKHATYLKNKQYGYTHSSYFVPNLFSFAITPDFLPFARRVLEGTPYGLYVVMNGICSEEIKPQSLKKETSITEDIMFRLARKACTENYFLRKKLAELKSKLPIDNIVED